jgi:hypothetical protein
LLTGKDQTLIDTWDPFLVKDLLHHIVNRFGTLNTQRELPLIQHLYDYLHLHHNYQSMIKATYRNQNPLQNLLVISAQWGKR